MLTDKVNLDLPGVWIVERHRVKTFMGNLEMGLDDKQCLDINWDVEKAHL